jgi:hypothetical protein
MSGARIARAATLAIVVLWGGILVIAQIEARLPEAHQWLGHLTVHLWTATVAAGIAIGARRALRDRVVPPGPLASLVAVTVVHAASTSVMNLLDGIGALPGHRALHDAAWWFRSSAALPSEPRPRT